MPSKKFLLVFFLINLIFSSFYLDHTDNPNSKSRVLMVTALSEKGNLQIDKNKDHTIDKAFVNEHYYAVQPPFPSLLTWPFYEVLKFIGLTKEYSEDKGFSIFLLGSFLIGSLPFALLILLIFWRLMDGGMDIYYALIISTIPLYGSMYFIYAGVFYSHVFVALLIAYAFHLISNDKHYFLAGLLSGSAFYSEYLTAVIFAIWFFQIAGQHFKKATLFGLGLLPFVLSFMYYNFHATGNALHTVYSHSIDYPMENVGFSYPKLINLFQMLFTPWRGAFIFVPLLISIFFSLDFRKWIGLKNLLQHKVWLPVILFTLTLSSYQEWAGGWTFGPRYLMPAITLVIIGFAHKVQLIGIKKWIFWIPISLGLVYTLLDKITVNFSIPSTWKYPFIQYIWPNLKSGNFNESNALNMFFELPFIYGALLFISMSLVALALLITCKRSINESRPS